MSYLKVEIDKCEELIDALHGIYAPEIAKDTYNYLFKFYTKYKQFLLYVYNYDDFNYDSSKVQSLHDEADYFQIQVNQEAERIKRRFNQKAKELDLPIPFSSK